MRLARAAVLVPILSGLTACPRPGAPDTLDGVDTRVRYEGRTVELAPFLVGDPWSPVLPVWETGTLLLDHQGARRTLRAVPMDPAGPPPDLASARPLAGVDWTTRNRWGLRAHPPSGHLYWQGDEINDEKIDVWRLPLGGGAPERLTDEPYIYGFSIAPDDARMAVVPRRGDGPYRSCLELLTLEGSEQTPVLCDTPSATFTWGRPSWAPDGRGVLVRVNVDGARRRGNVAWVPLDAPELRLVLDPAPARRTALPLAPWLDADTAALVVDDGDRERVVALDVETGATRVLHRAAGELASAHVLAPGGTPRLVVVEHTPVEDTLLLVDPDTGAVLDRETVSGSVSWLGDDEAGQALLGWTSAASPRDSGILAVSPDALELRPWLGLDEATAASLVRCRVERVRLPTWDQDPTTGAPRTLHAFLYTPLDGPPRARQRVRVTAFYGGSNRFSAETQAHCAAGIATLSPAVRGSRGFGPAFEALNDGDLGGDEIVDLFAAARWLVDQGFSPGRIGVHGGSHGGYATLRALTFDPAGTGHDPALVFPFAFGVSRAGFSDILTFHAGSNIPDWVRLEAGDPETDAERLRGRSPLQAVERLEAPVLLLHGANDSRVPVGESRQMAEACARVGAPCTYLEFEGVGHHIRSVPDQIRMYEAIFGLLERVGE
jgi:dipeptidyl aminopeptidase/acylaminoacyl peptidase